MQCRQVHTCCCHLHWLLPPPPPPMVSPVEPSTMTSNRSSTSLPGALKYHTGHIWTAAGVATSSNSCPHAPFSFLVLLEDTWVAVWSGAAFQKISLTGRHSRLRRLNISSGFKCLGKQRDDLSLAVVPEFTVPTPSVPVCLYKLLREIGWTRRHLLWAALRAGVM